MTANLSGTPAGHNVCNPYAIASYENGDTTSCHERNGIAFTTQWFTLTLAGANTWLEGPYPHIGNWHCDFCEPTQEELEWADEVEAAAADQEAAAAAPGAATQEQQHWPVLPTSHPAPTPRPGLTHNGHGHNGGSGQSGRTMGNAHADQGCCHNAQSGVAIATSFRQLVGAGTGDDYVLWPWLLATVEDKLRCIPDLEGADLQHKVELLKHLHLIISAACGPSGSIARSLTEDCYGPGTMRLRARALTCTQVTMADCVEMLGTMLAICTVFPSSNGHGLTHCIAAAAIITCSAGIKSLNNGRNRSPQHFLGALSDAQTLQA
jgi:hypothetical protein